jgi:hypothetical protein
MFNICREQGAHSYFMAFHPIAYLIDILMEYKRRFAVARKLSKFMPKTAP